MTIQTVTDAIRYVGVDDNTLALFENQYPVQPMGVSYNSYVILDEKIAVMASCEYLEQMLTTPSWQQHFHFAISLQALSLLS